MPAFSPGTRVKVTNGSSAGRTGTIVEYLDMHPDFYYLDPNGAYDVAIDNDPDGQDVHPIQHSFLAPITDPTP